MKTTELKPDLRTEFIAGVTTFFTMAYIVVVNPLILSTKGTGSWATRRCSPCSGSPSQFCC